MSSKHTMLIVLKPQFDRTAVIAQHTPPCVRTSSISLRRERSRVSLMILSKVSAYVKRPPGRQQSLQALTYKGSTPHRLDQYNESRWQRQSGTVQSIPECVVRPTDYLVHRASVTIQEAIQGHCDELYRDQRVRLEHGHVRMHPN
jgi:hypothetical protein